MQNFNCKLFYFIENIWSSLDYENKNINLEIKYLKLIIRLFFKLNNKLNLMNLSIYKIWEYIYFKDKDLISFFKLSYLKLIRNNLVNKIKNLKKFIKRLLKEFKSFKNKKSISNEFKIILITSKFRRLYL